MTNLPWLIQASGPGPAAGAAGRTEQAARDLAVLAERLARQDLHLVVEDAVDIAFELGPRHLPAGSVDARGSDALAVALDDPTGVLITADGINRPWRCSRPPLGRARRVGPLSGHAGQQRTVRPVLRAFGGWASRRSLP